MVESESNMDQDTATSFKVAHQYSPAQKSSSSIKRSSIQADNFQADYSGYPGWPADATIQAETSNHSTSIDVANISSASTIDYPEVEQAPLPQIRRVVSKPLPRFLDVDETLTPTSSKKIASSVFSPPNHITSTPNAASKNASLPLLPSPFMFGSPNPTQPFTFGLATESQAMQERIIMDQVNRRIAEEGGVKVGASYKTLYPSAVKDEEMEVLQVGDRYASIHAKEFDRFVSFSSRCSVVWS